MEPLITAAARAVEAGDPLGALNRVALRNDAPSLALRHRDAAQRQRGRSVAQGDAVQGAERIAGLQRARGGRDQ